MIHRNVFRNANTEYGKAELNFESEVLVSKLLIQTYCAVYAWYVVVTFPAFRNFQMVIFQKLFQNLWFMCFILY